MPISNFTQVTQQPGVSLQSVVGRTESGKLELREPLNPPGKWTQFKAALSNVPLLGQLGSLRQARSECEAYPLRLQEYQATNRQVLAGFMKDLRTEFGDQIAEMTQLNLGVQDGAPLKARDVSTAIEGAKRAQQHCRSQNNQTVTRLLESPLQGGQRLRGEQDMSDVFLERGLPLNGKSSWQAAVGPEAATFITRQVMGKCQALPGHGTGRLESGQIAKAMDDALALYEEISKAPGMTQDKLTEIFAKANEKPDANSALKMARELVIMSHVEPMLNRRDPESMIRQQALAVAREHGLPPPPDAVLKSIANSMDEKVRMGASLLPQQLKCGTDCTSVVEAVKPVLTGHVREALDQHYQALKLIDSSTRLNEAQKEYLKEIAGQRRMDPVQVAHYEKLAASLAQTMQACARCGGDPAKAVAQLLGALRDFETSLSAMGQHGASFWESGSLAGGDTTVTLMSQFMTLAAAGMDDPRALLDGLTGDAMKQLVQGLAVSPSSRMSNSLPEVLGAMIMSVASRCGIAKPEAMDLARSVVGSEVGPRSGMPPALLLQVLTSDQDMIDARGVVDGARNGKQVAREFRQEEVLGQVRQELLDYIHSDPVDEARGITKTTAKDLNRATFHIGGEELPRDGDKVQKKLDDSFPDTDEGRKMKLAVSRCMNQLGINAFFMHCEGQAYGEGSSAPALHGRTQFEAWPQEDGSWIVRNTHAREPQMIVRPDGTQVELPKDGVAVYSLTYRVGPGLDPGGNPVIDVIGSQVAFDI
jgi:hypothetical protein